MAKPKIGVCLSALGLSFRRGLEELRRLGVGGVELAASGELAPDRLSQTGRRELKHLLRSHNVELTALSCPLRRGLDSADNLQPRIEHVQKVLSLSFDLGPRLAIVQAGQAPEKADDSRGGFLTESLRTLAQYGDKIGATLALETGLESGEVMRQFLDGFDTGSLAVNFNPGNLLISGIDPYASARALAGRIVHAHAKDARVAAASRAAREVPLGHGDIDWLQLLAVLEEIDYHGWLAIEREGANPGEVAAGVEFLRRLIGA